MNIAKVIRINKNIVQWNAHMNKLQHNRKNYERKAHISTNNLIATSIAKQHVFISHSQDIALIKVETNMKLTIIPEMIIPNYIST